MKRHKGTIIDNFDFVILAIDRGFLLEIHSAVVSVVRYFLCTETEIWFRFWIFGLHFAQIWHLYNLYNTVASLAFALKNILVIGSTCLGIHNYECVCENTNAGYRSFLSPRPCSLFVIIRDILCKEIRFHVRIFGLHDL